MDLATVWTEKAPEICSLVERINKHNAVWQVLWKVLTAIGCATIVASLMNDIAFTISFGLLLIGVGYAYYNNWGYQKCVARIRELTPEFYGILGTVTVRHGDQSALYLWGFKRQYTQLPVSAIHGDDPRLVQAKALDPGFMFQHREETCPLESWFSRDKVLYHNDGRKAVVNLTMAATAQSGDPDSSVKNLGYPDAPGIWFTIVPIVIQKLEDLAKLTPSGIWAFQGEINDLFTQIDHFGPFEVKFEWTATYEDGTAIVPMSVDFPASVEVRHASGNDRRIINYSVSAVADGTDMPFTRLAHMIAAIRRAVEPKIRDFAAISQPRVWSKPESLRNLYPQINCLRIGPYQLTLESVEARDCSKTAVAV